MCFVGGEAGRESWELSVEGGSPAVEDGPEPLPQTQGRTLPSERTPWNHSHHLGHIHLPPHAGTPLSLHEYHGTHSAMFVECP